MPFTDLTEQDGTNNCGAFALAAVLLEKKETKKAHKLNTANLASGYNSESVTISNSSDHRAFAKNIYQVTGNLNISEVEAKYEYGENMNAPSALVYVASLFGFDKSHITVYHVNSNLVIANFHELPVTNEGNSGDLFATEKQLIDGLAEVSSTDSYTRPKSGNVHIVLVNGGSHWIASDGIQIYDPASGVSNLSAFSPIIPDGFSGLWIELRK